MAGWWNSHSHDCDTLYKIPECQAGWRFFCWLGRHKNSHVVRGTSGWDFRAAYRSWEWPPVGSWQENENFKTLNSDNPNELGRGLQMITTPSSHLGFSLVRPWAENPAMTCQDLALQKLWVKMWETHQGQSHNSDDRSWQLELGPWETGKNESVQGLLHFHHMDIELP